MSSDSSMTKERALTITNGLYKKKVVWVRGWKVPLADVIMEQIISLHNGFVLK
jgi:hypothetical protein